MAIDERHPGFSDAEYRSRRNIIASVAQNYQSGMEVPDVLYSSEEDAVWQGVYTKLEQLYPTHAIDAYNKSFKSFGLEKKRVPQFSEINKKLERVNVALEPIDGLVDSRKFLSRLEDGTMLCTQYIRHHSVPEYTPEPDIIHEIFGHAVFFLDPSIRRLNRLFGKAAKVCTDDHLVHLERLYWYTIEFGLCMEKGDRRAYGAGLLSSIGELTSINEVACRPFDIEEIISTPYDTQNKHTTLFCAQSFECAERETSNYLKSFSA